MEYGQHQIDKLSAFSDTLLNALRLYLKKYHLMYWVRIFRLTIHFGPWRKIPQFLIRQFRPPVKTSPTSSESLLGPLDANAIAEEVRKNSISIASILPSDFVNRMQTIADHLPVDHYQLMHHLDEDVHRLSEDPAIKNVLRAYLKSEPILLESTLVITGSHQLHGLSEQNSFHFDYAGWESLNVFVYLSDMTAESSCHMVARGSHRNRSFRDLLRSSLTDNEALQRFGSSIQVVTGKAGTLFFENTEAFHRRQPGSERRVMLNLLYASHKNWFSYGRTSRSHLNRRTRAYAQLRAENRVNK